MFFSYYYYMCRMSEILLLFNDDQIFCYRLNILRKVLQELITEMCTASSPRKRPDVCAYASVPRRIANALSKLFYTGIFELQHCPAQWAMTYKMLIFRYIFIPCGDGFIVRGAFFTILPQTLTLTLQQIESKLKTNPVRY